MRGSTVELVRDIEKSLFKSRLPKWNINRRIGDRKPMLIGSKIHRHWSHLGWGTGQVGIYAPRRKIFQLQPWRFREFVVPSIENTQLKPYMSPSTDPEFTSDPLYFTDLFSDELASQDLKNNPRLLEACRTSASTLAQYLKLPYNKRIEY